MSAIVVVGVSIFHVALVCEELLFDVRLGFYVKRMLGCDKHPIGTNWSLSSSRLPSEINASFLVGTIEVDAWKLIDS